MGGKTMKFLTLVKKEFRECLPWICLAGIVFMAAGVLLLDFQLRVDQWSRQRPSETHPGILVSYSPLQNLGLLLVIVAVYLGIVMGIRQFLPPTFDKTWSFTLHRPVHPWTIVMAKFLAAGLGLAVSTGLPWVLMYLYAASPGRFLKPVLPRVFWEGCLMIALGLVAYLGAAVSAMRPVRWYTTRIFGAAFGVGVCMLCIMGTPLAHAWVLVVVGACVLAAQVLNAVCLRET
jgi:ABC-type transport system involved in multi-copper enzyme maturation permease subunit